MIRLETLIELKILSSSFSSLSSYYNLTDSSLSSNSRQQYLKQQYPPPLLGMGYIRLEQIMEENPIKQSNTQAHTHIKT